MSRGKFNIPKYQVSCLKSDLLRKTGWTGDSEYMHIRVYGYMVKMDV